MVFVMQILKVFDEVDSEDNRIQYFFSQFLEVEEDEEFYDREKRMKAIFM